MVTPQQCREMLLLCEGNKTKAAAQLGIPRTTFRQKLGEPDAFEIDKPDDPRPIDELLEYRKKQFLRKQKFEEQTKLIPVKIKIKGPIAITHFGDPHVDDDGTDLIQLERDATLVQATDGMFGANVGDTTNNWVGRLARLYGEQGTTASEAWQLAEWFLNLVDWLYVIGGNHDCWSGAGDPIKWIQRNCSGIYQSSEIRLALTFPNGREVRINAHHDFAGNSQWNPAHGAMKAAQMGFRDHILVNGHKHVSGYGVVKCPATGIVSHCIQVASYKIYDRYAKEKGFRDQHISPCTTTVIDPDAKSEKSLIQNFWDVEEAADYLTHKRKKVKCS